MHARNINEYPHNSKQAAAIMVMISNNLDTNIAQHPYEMGEVALEKAWELLQGKSIPSEIPIKIELITVESLTNN